MRSTVLLLLGVTLLVAFATSQTCNICKSIPNCDPNLLKDSAIDAIVSKIAKQIGISTTPTTIVKKATQIQANYTICWS